MIEIDFCYRLIIEIYEVFVGFTSWATAAAAARAAPFFSNGNSIGGPSASFLINRLKGHTPIGVKEGTGFRYRVVVFLLLIYH